MRRMGGWLAWTGLLVIGCGTDSPPADVRVEVEGSGAVSFPATVQTERFTEGGEMSGYHFLVWEEGRAADQALLRAWVSDVEVLDALEGLGAEPGDGLGIDSWDERGDPSSPAPDRRVVGPEVAITIRLENGRELGLEQILDVVGEEELDMRFGGHRENIPHWRSGCIVCLFSCPGGKVGNASYTVRDYARGMRFRPRPGVLPPDGSRVQVVLRVGDLAAQGLPGSRGG